MSWKHISPEPGLPRWRRPRPVNGHPLQPSVRPVVTAPEGLPPVDRTVVVYDQQGPVGPGSPEDAHPTGTEAAQRVVVGLLAGADLVVGSRAPGEVLREL